jgi:hypothetical protein
MLRRTAILVAVGLIVAIGSALEARPAQAASCNKVQAAGRTADRIHTHHIKCMSARVHLRRWMRLGFPHGDSRWYCDAVGEERLCVKAGAGGSPYVSFRLSRPTRAR